MDERTLPTRIMRVRWRHIIGFTLGDVMSLGELLLVLFLVFIWIAWIWLVIAILMDVFRSDDLSGGWKAYWTVVVIVFSWLGVLAYLIARGKGMSERRRAEAEATHKAQADHIRSIAADSGATKPSTADELEKLADLRAKGVLSDDEFAAHKAKLLSS